jgi:hypothetical protein
VQEIADGGGIVQSDKVKGSLLLSATGTIDELGTEGEKGVELADEVNAKRRS